MRGKRGWQSDGGGERRDGRVKHRKIDARREVCRRGAKFALIDFLQADRIGDSVEAEAVGVLDQRASRSSAVEAGLIILDEVELSRRLVEFERVIGGGPEGGDAGVGRREIVNIGGSGENGDGGGGTSGMNVAGARGHRPEEHKAEM